MQFMLDTDTCIYLINKHTDMKPVGRPDDCCISVIVLGELERGCLLSQRPEPTRAFINGMAIAEMPTDAAVAYAQIRVDLEKKGEIIGPNDLWIAAHALCFDVPLVTNNTREFSRVEGLQIENWLASFC
ncbi:MAG: type II toxin-antitoxin system VapC family toxin [Gammaproteobacteria bacterium]|nr:type II toxin-antitoxin system VapC family toxin [Gammaproteobacteria bacterium]